MNSPSAMKVCEAMAPEVESITPSSKFQVYSAMLKPGAANEDEPLKVNDSPTHNLKQVSGAIGIGATSPAVGRVQGVVQVIVAAKFPVPALLEWNSTVMQPEVLNEVQETTNPCRPFPP
jgi:hypothetical protein